jgi:hypothetical protein
MSQEQESSASTTPAKAQKTSKKKSSKKAKATKSLRTARVYPAVSFEEALKLGEAIHQYASGERVNRLTLLQKLNKSPTSSAIQTLITSSGKYGITKGSYVADYLELTAVGKIATDSSAKPQDKFGARFKLAIEEIPPFRVLYEKYKGKKLPAHEVLIDALKEAKLQIGGYEECVDLFVVNAKFLGLLQTIAGSETLLPSDTVSEQVNDGTGTHNPADVATKAPAVIEARGTKPKWANICFYITPIGEEGSEQRKHSDLFLSSIVEPALKGFSLEVVRADKIGEPGMITAQILEHIVYSRLVIVDLSYHNPNVFYEMAARHMCKLPVIQICRKADKIPFDVNQIRTITVDTTDIYSLLPKIDTYKSEVATQVRAALDGQTTSNPISLFFPTLEVKVPKSTT